jgi:hypothetical protein
LYIFIVRGAKITFCCTVAMVVPNASLIRTFTFRASASGYLSYCSSQNLSFQSYHKAMLFPSREFLLSNRYIPEAVPVDCASSTSTSFVVTAAAIFIYSYGVIGWLTNCLLLRPFPPHLIADQGRSEPREHAHRQGIPDTVDGANHGSNKRPSCSSFCEGISKNNNN